MGLRCSTRTVQHLCLELTYQISLLQKATDSCSELCTVSLSPNCQEIRNKYCLLLTLMIGLIPGEV